MADLFVSRERINHRAQQSETRVADLFALTWRTATFWIERARQRRMIAEFDDRLLDDIGMTRQQAVAEARKPFWR